MTVFLVPGSFLTKNSTKNLQQQVSSPCELCTPSVKRARNVFHARDYIVLVPLFCNFQAIVLKNQYNLDKTYYCDPYLIMIMLIDNNDIRLIIKNLYSRIFPDNE